MHVHHSVISILIQVLKKLILSESMTDNVTTMYIIFGDDIAPVCDKINWQKSEQSEVLLSSVALKIQL